MSDFLDRIKAAFSTPEMIAFSVVDILITILLVYAVVIFLKKNKKVLLNEN